MLKRVIALLLVVGVLSFGVNSTEALAESIMENEPNNSLEMAETIQVSKDKPMDHSGQRVTTGYTSITDQDWFKVYLLAGEHHMVCNGKDFNFEIIDINMNIVKKGEFVQTGAGSNGFALGTSYRVHIKDDGYYYIKIWGNQESSTNYRFSIGSPTHYTGEIQILADRSITLSATNRTQTAIFQLGDDQTVPENAIVTSLWMKGVRTTDASAIRVYYSADRSLDLAKYTWDIKNLESMNMNVDHEWEAEFTFAIGEKTFRPTLYIQYAYPLPSID